MITSQTSCPSARPRLSAADGVRWTTNRAPKVNELKLIDIPGGEYEVTATLFDMRGDRTVVRRTLMVSAAGSR